MTIFDLMTAPELTAYWETLNQDRAPFIGEELFPAAKKSGLSLKWIKGSKGLPVVLNISAFDSKAIPRGRIGFERVSAEMPFFKESTYIDEELRQELNMVLETGNQAYIDSVMNRVFDDEVRLLEGAAAARERMRMMALCTGAIAMSSNGQALTYNYGVSHTGNAAESWSVSASADPIEDLRKAKEEIKDDTGADCTRAICDGATWRALRNCDSIKKAVFVLSNGVGALSDNRLRQFIMDELELQIVVNDKRYVNEAGATVKYVPANTIVLFPSGPLGRTWFGTTPEESDLLASNVANVAITDTGVAVTTIKNADPVNVETKVTQICLPSFELADQVYILSTVKA